MESRDVDATGESGSNDATVSVTPETCLGDDWGSQINDLTEGIFALTVGADGFITGTFPKDAHPPRPIIGGRCEGPAAPGGKKRLTLIREEGENIYLYTGTIRVVQTIPELKLEAKGKRVRLGKPTDAPGDEGHGRLLDDDDWVATRPPT